MTGEIQRLLDQYWSWLQEQTMVREVGDHVEITTPYLDRHNDCLQMYASKTKEGFILTDDGYYGVRTIRWSDREEAVLHLAT